MSRPHLRRAGPAEPRRTERTTTAELTKLVAANLMGAVARFALMGNWVFARHEPVGAPNIEKSAGNAGVAE